MECYEDKVTLQGKIIRKQVNEEKGMGSIVLSTTSSRDKAKQNCPLIVCFEPEKLAEYNVGDYVSVAAELRSYLTKEDGRNRRRQSIVLQQISAAKTRIEQEYGFESAGIFNKQNDVRLAGIVTSKKQLENDMWSFVLRVVVSGHVNMLLVKVYENEHNKETLEKMDRGQNVCVIGTMQTKYRQREGNRRTFFEDVIALDISTSVA